MGVCRDCCSTVFRCWLLILNVFDGCFGITLIAYAIWFTTSLDTSYAYDKLAAQFWMLPLAIGVTLLVSSLMSIFGLVFDGCKCFLGLSAALSVPLLILMLVTASEMMIKKDKFFDYLDENKDDESSVESIKTWFRTLAVAFFVTAALQLVRCVMSRKLVAYIRLDAKELRSAFLEEQFTSQRRQAEKKEEIKDKYDDIRNKFRDKYGSKYIRATKDENQGPGLI